MRAGDYCWGELRSPQRVEEVRGDRLWVAGRALFITRDRIRGSVSPGDRVFWLPLSNNWQEAIVQDKAELWIKLKKTGVEIQIFDCRYLQIPEE